MTTAVQDAMIIKTRMTTKAMNADADPAICGTSRLENSALLAMSMSFLRTPPELWYVPQIL